MGTDYVLQFFSVKNYKTAENSTNHLSLRKYKRRLRILRILDVCLTKKIKLTQK
jgi:hypothetical protein